MNRDNFLSPVYFGKDVCRGQPKIPEYLKKNLKGLLENFPSNYDVTTDELFRR